MSTTLLVILSKPITMPDWPSVKPKRMIENSYF